MLGGLAGLLVGVGALAIPGIGPLLAAGPLAATLAGGAIGATAGGIVGALVHHGVPEDNAGVYGTAVERGGILLTVKTTKKREAEIRHILEQNGLKGTEYHRSQWEKNPDFEYDIEKSTDVSTHQTENRDKVKVDGKAGGTAVGGTAGAVVGAMVGGPIGAAVGAVAGSAIGGAAGSAGDYKEVEPELRSHYETNYKGKTKATWDQASPAYQYAWESYEKPEYRGKSWDEVNTHLKSNWSGKGKWEEYEPIVRGAWEHRAQHTINQGGEAVVPVVEEELHVGKRKVEKGGVKVTTRVTETPVEEQIHLHEEHVEVKRRPAHRAATAADTAFQEGTLELTETAEEAVVAKKSKVVEEVVIKKHGSDKTHTVKDTVRRTDVDVVETDADHNYDTYETAFRSHHKKHFAKIGEYETYSPAYRFGYDYASTNPQGGEWAVVEPVARKSWEKSHKGTWEEFKDAIHHGWEKVTGQH